MRGFTLIEILIYVAILAGVLVSATAFGFRILEDRAKTAVDREVQQNARFALETINRAVRSASGINEPPLGATSTALNLEMAVSTANPTVFSLDGDVLKMSEGGGSAVPLTSDQIRVTSILFTNTSYSGTPGNIKIDLSLEYRNPSGRKEYDKRIAIAASSPSLREGGSAPPPPVCSGVPTACSAFFDQTSCGSQDGCVWNPAVCNGTYQASCSVFTARGPCQNQAGCTWNNATKTCGGTYDVSCNGFSDKTSCDTQTDCTWNPATCSETAATCDTYTDQASCTSQAGCAWQ